MLLDGKVTVISGVGPGLGRQLALGFAREGAPVVLGARTESYLKEVAAEVEAAGGRALPVPTDVTDPEQCRRIVDAAVAEFGRLDGVVASAFVPGPFKRFEDVDLAAWRGVFEVNLFGALQLAQAAIAPMKEAGRGSIVFVNSMVVRKYRERQSAYAASKGALLIAARALAAELGPHRIRVNSIVPGWMLGPSVEMMFDYVEQKTGRSRQEQYDEIAARTALGVVPPDADCANAAVFLASDLASMITGQALDVNGGEVFH